ncbi:unnamed protein product [Citrullus colocynthis]|uniref:Uncharacterized protein n=1 Tax=Citrullus colocynthis TaxID=252529 RepID=A0ABP0XP96_9ROSI
MRKFHNARTGIVLDHELNVLPRKHPTSLLSSSLPPYALREHHSFVLTEIFFLCSSISFAIPTLAIVSGVAFGTV